MKKIISILFFLLVYACSYAQLENIIVETYYISDANDYAASLSASGDTLPVGSVTYRIYVDMLPGYKLLNVYGSPAHELHFSTTTSFFNNTNGSADPHDITKVGDASGSTMLDSWISMGEACKNYVGVLKSADNGSSTVVNADNMLQNNDPMAGIPLTQQDGMITYGTTTRMATIGLDAATPVLDNVNGAGSLFSVNGGSWYQLSGTVAGVVGHDTSNTVLIAQLTTDGTFCFQLNIQIEDTGNVATYNYVANSPDVNEIAYAGLSNCFTLSGKDIKAIKPAVKVYPNPASDIVNMEILSPKESTVNSYAIYGVTGNLIAQKKLARIHGSYSEPIDISSLASGLYIVQVTMDSVTSYEKIVKN